MSTPPTESVPAGSTTAVDVVSQRRASLVVCGNARDKGDARLLLQALGLFPYESAPAVSRWGKS